MNPSYNRTFDLSAKKRAFLETMLREEGLGSAASHRIPHRTDSGGPPLSFAQQRLWFLDQLAPGSPFYNIPVATRLHGSLDLAALADSFAAIMRRHDVLRTTFHMRDSQPLQHIAPTLALPLLLIDLQPLPDDQRADCAHQLVIEEAQRPFDLARGPLLRITLLHLAPHEHLLLLTLHHSIADGWSADLLLRELGELYSAAISAQPHALPPLPIQYADYAVWEREWLQGARLEQQLSYWQRQLAGAPALLELPSDRPRPAVQTFRGASQPLVLAPALRAALLGLSRQAGVTLFMTLLAAFQVLLSRYSGQEDIVVGTPIANRSHAEVQGLIGFFANTLVIRSDLSGNPSFRALLGRVREVCLSAYAHQNLPFEKLVEQLHPDRNLSFNPLFQVLFALQDALTEEVKLTGLTTSPYSVSSGMAKIDLSLVIINADQGRVGEFTYNTDLFDAATIVRMAGHFLTLLEGIVENPEAQLSRLPLMTHQEQQQLLVVWNDTKADYPRGMCLHHLFEAQVERSPDAVALVFPATLSTLRSAQDPGPIGVERREDEHLTYQTLNQRANQLAHHLRRLGVGPDVPVGICVERSLEMVIGMLGILKAGGTYVPLDPAYPQERLAFMIADIGAPVLLTQARLHDRLPAHAAKIVYLDAGGSAWAYQHDDAPPSGVSADHLAYIIYTSGSTGQPKGVCVPHQGIVNQLYARQASCELNAEDRVLQHMSLAFDPSVWELFAPLISGSCLVVARPGGHKDAAYLVKLLVEQRVSVLQLVPSVLQLLLEEPDIRRCRSLRHVFCGGEALSNRLRECFFSCLVANLHHLYGPTEAAIDATAWPCPRDGQQEEIIPIGRPIANSQIYLLDTDLRPVPVGVAGQLFIGGDGLARGYLNRPDLTAERFIPNPFAVGDWGLGTGDWGNARPPTPHSPIPNPRLYRAGDLARYRADGSIEFLGRIDGQVKLRGYRIELGEVEAALGRHPQVREAAVVIREDVPRDRRLVAYVVPTRDQGTGNREGIGSNIAALSPVTHHPSPEELRDFLKERLPQHMLPAAFVLLDALPLLPNGKIDLAALPAPVPSLNRGAVGANPQTDVERTIAAIWQEVLHLDAVGRHDNFFDIGGHSLLIAQVHRKLRDACAGDLSLVDLFQYPTIATLARHLSQPGTPPAAEPPPVPENMLQQRRSRLNQLRQRQSA